MYKKYLLFALIPFFLFSQEEEDSRSLWDYHPLHLGGNILYITQANIDAPQGGNLLFNKENIFLNMLLPVSEKTFFIPQVAWNRLNVNWNNNPKFNETNFYYLQFALTFYTSALENWRWILRADYNMDLKHFLQVGTYALFSGIIWGTNKLSENWHYHVGATGYVGLDGDILYPLIGIDYIPNEHWILRAIFPIDYTVGYKFDKHWCLALKGRPLKERFRTGSHEPQPRSIFNYSSVGLEVNLQYEIEMKFVGEIYGGYNFGGKFYIKNQGGHKALYTDVEGAPYLGLKLDYGF
jgi:hypothetical protein